MLAPLAYYLLVMLIACTVALLVFWSYEPSGAASKPDGSRIAAWDSHFLAPRRFASVRAALGHTHRQPLRSDADEREVGRYLRAKRKSRPAPRPDSRRVADRLRGCW
jgi:hypothetical protein